MFNLVNLVEQTLRKFSMSVALPVISFRHFGQTCWARLDLNRNIRPHTFVPKVLTHLQVSQMWCPLLHWKILVGGTISSRQTCGNSYQNKIYNKKTKH